MICTYVSEISERLSNLKSKTVRTVCHKQTNKKWGLEVLFHDKDGEKPRGMTEADSKNQMKTFRLTFLSH